MPKVKKTNEEKEVTITVRISPELLEIFEKMRKQLGELTYEALDDVSYNDLSRILARKIKSSKLF